MINHFVTLSFEMSDYLVFKFESSVITSDMDFHRQTLSKLHQKIEEPPVETLVVLFQ
jgi:hypothetical protein